MKKRLFFGEGITIDLGIFRSFSKDEEERLRKAIDGLSAKIPDESRTLEALKEDIEYAKRLRDELEESCDAIDQKLRIRYGILYAEESFPELNEQKENLEREVSSLSEEFETLQSKNSKLSKQVDTATKKIIKIRELYNSVQYTIDKFSDTSLDEEYHIPKYDADELNELAPSVILHLHAMDMKDLRKAYVANNKQIEKLLDEYSKRYTTKANKSLYSLMVIALRAELQNVLYEMKYEKLGVAVEKIKEVTAKYLNIATDGSKVISGTMVKFIGQVEYLFLNAVKIEYNYYVKKEQARQEQLAIKEQLRQDAIEKKALEAERKKIEEEERKYITEIERIQTLLETVAPEEKEVLLAKRSEVEAKMSEVIVKKDTISALQHGKAGYVYIISNLGSFGPNKFKIGMTRRTNPHERINELSSASVPFPFDVHSLIFSQDAVALENRLHEALNEKRVNKVNVRKEFFETTIDELEGIVMEIDPTAEFCRTMNAEDYWQSLSTDKIYTTDFCLDEDEEEEE